MMEAVAKKRVSLRINGIEQTHEVEPRLLLVDFLRDVARLTGTHVGCDTSICGACTVMLNGAAVKSCTVLTVQADGTELLTIEGVAQGDKLHPLQEAFWECHGLQCGTPRRPPGADEACPLEQPPRWSEVRYRRPAPSALCTTLPPRRSASPCKLHRCWCRSRHGCLSAARHRGENQPRVAEALLRGFARRR